MYITRNKNLPLEASLSQGKMSQCNKAGVQALHSLHEPPDSEETCSHTPSSTTQLPYVSQDPLNR